MSSRPAEAAAPTMTRAVQSIALPNRVRLVYVEQGDPAGIPVLLLHGVTDSWRSFERVLPHLPDSIHAFAVTQRGHGDSDRPESGYLARDFAADAAAFAEAVGLGRIVVVGHSMGSSHAQRFAIDYPERTQGLVLAATFAGYRGNPVVEEFLETVVSRLEDPIDRAFVREFQVSTLGRPVPPEYLETVVAESLKVPARVWRAVFAGFREEDSAAELFRIAAPTLIVWGDRDAFCPRRDQDALLAAIRGSRLVVYEGAGHAVHWEEPERFAADVVAFCESLAADERRTGGGRPFGGGRVA
jgi:non-heme chloroperoxidase